MKFSYIKAFDLPSSWFKTVSEIWNNGEAFIVKYGSETTLTKKLAITVEVEHPETRPLLDSKAPCDEKFLNYYSLAYLYNGEKQDETYTYGERLNNPINQIQECINRYVEELNDRQVTMVIRLPKDILKEIDGKRHEPPCLSLIDTEISNNEFNAICYFRSWDAYAGMPVNIAGLQMLFESMLAEMNARLAKDIIMGKLIFHAKNAHIYQRQFPLVENLLNPKIERRKIA